MNHDHPFIPYNPKQYSEDQQFQRGKEFYQQMDKRRTVRQYSTKPVPRELIELAIKTASTAPSGAHHQPWRFVVISDPALKSLIRDAAEEEERKGYESRMSEEWLSALAPLETNAEKEHIDQAPWLVVLFEETYSHNEDGSVRKNYYVKESVGIAAGMFITALHNMGLCTLTHTPSPMGFLRNILGRPKNEKPFILFPIGYPSENCEVPDLTRKSLEEVSIWNPKPVQEEK